LAETESGKPAIPWLKAHPAWAVDVPAVTSIPAMKSQTETLTKPESWGKRLVFGQQGLTDISRKREKILHRSFIPLIYARFN
jgi:hypothetical protein